MGRKNEVDPMVQGFGMAQSFLRMLFEEIEEQGGCAAQVHFMTTPQGAENLRSVAKVIANAPWMWPLSLVRRVVGEWSQREGGSQPTVEMDMAWIWFGDPLRELMIPNIAWEEHQGPFDGLEAIKDQIRGKVFTSPIFVLHNGRKYLFVNFDLSVTDFCNPNAVRFLENIDKLSFFTLIEAHLIDLTK